MRFERIGCYDVTALIGEGGMGQVYQASDSAHIDASPEDGQRRRLFMKRNPWLVLVPLALVAVACSARQEPALVPNAVSPDVRTAEQK